VEILSAQANGITLWLLAAWFLYEAVSRFVDPPQVQGSFVLGTALAGIVVNLAATWLVSRANRTSLNVEGAFQHILNDLFAFIATAAAGLVIVLTGWVRADAVAAVIVAALMIKGGWGLLRDSWRIFLEAAPAGIDVEQVDADLHAVDGVVEVHDLHIWEVTSGFPAMSAHILVGAEWDCHERRQSIAGLVSDRYGIDHSTLQLDHPAAPDLIEPESLLDGNPGGIDRPRRCGEDETGTAAPGNGGAGQGRDVADVLRGTAEAVDPTGHQWSRLGAADLSRSGERAHSEDAEPRPCRGQGAAAEPSGTPREGQR
jgi:cobalt-zinc-cadmium efflux system protein